MSDLPPRILVVDDNGDNRFTLVRRLKRLGYGGVETANDGAEALGRIGAGGIDLVLLDIMMPRVDGYQVLEAMKRDMEMRHLPVIMISAVDELESVVRCIELGAEDYLPKPFNVTLLKARIGASLEKKRLRDQEALFTAQLAEEKRRSEQLLNVILPAAAVRELKAAGRVAPRRYEGVAIMFCDIVGFTAFCQQNEAEHVVGHLQGLIESFEDIVHRHGLEKIKTIGDAFMATAGLLRPVDLPLLAALRCAFEMVRASTEIAPNWQVRVGLHYGPVVAGIVGKKQYLFDVWGDAVNTAARLVEHGGPGTVAMTYDAWREIKDECRARSLGPINIKGKGVIEIIECYAMRETATSPPI